MNGKRPKAPPSQIQLPGGITLKGLQFKVVEWNPDGTPKLFELLPDAPRYVGPGAVVLWGSRDELPRSAQ